MPRKTTYTFAVKLADLHLKPFGPLSVTFTRRNQLLQRPAWIFPGSTIGPGTAFGLNGAMRVRLVKPDWRPDLPRLSGIKTGWVVVLRKTSGIWAELIALPVHMDKVRTPTGRHLEIVLLQGAQEYQPDVWSDQNGITSSGPVATPTARLKKQTRGSVRRGFTNWLKRDLGAEDSGGPVYPFRTPDHPASERQRYTDTSLLTGDFYPGDRVEPSDRLTPDAKLLPASRFTLEVAIRADPIGLSDVAVPAAVRPVRKDQETLTYYTLVTCLTPGVVTLPDPLAKLRWRYDQDSEPAFLRFQTAADLSEDPVFEVKVFSGDLTLLSLLRVRRIDGGWRQETLVLPDIEAVPAEREDALAFHLSGDGDTVRFDCVLKRKGKDAVAVDLNQRLPAAEARDVLVKSRTHWADLVRGLMSRRTRLSSAGMTKQTEELGKIGRLAWNALLPKTRGAAADAGGALRSILEEDPLPEGAPIKITQDDTAAVFAFPWAVVNPAPSGAPPAFWGLHHPITIAVAKGQRPRKPKNKHVRVSATVDLGFSNSAEHLKFLESLPHHHGQFKLKQVGSTPDILDALSEDPTSDVYYFFCHGKSGAPQPGHNADHLLPLAEGIKKIEDEETQKLYQRVLDLLGTGPQSAALYSGKSWLDEDVLSGSQDYFDYGAPLVFLNCCYSADLTPGLSGGLTRFFLNRGAFAVIGTECPSTAPLADQVAQKLFGHLLKGASLSGAMLKTRQELHADRNPLALLYTIYGRADFYLTEPNTEISNVT